MSAITPLKRRHLRRYGVTCKVTLNTLEIIGVAEVNRAKEGLMTTGVDRTLVVRLSGEGAWSEFNNDGAVWLKTNL